MNYSRFKKKLVEGIKDYLPEEFQDCTVEVEMVPKVNGFKEALIISKPDCKDPTPTLYVDQMFDHYRACNSMEKVLKFAAEYYIYGVNYAKAMAECMDVKGEDLGDDKIIMMLVNRENNKKMLETMPHRDYMDLAIIYRVIMPLPDGSFNLASITDDMAERMEKDEEELFRLAVVNTQKILPPRRENVGECVYVVTNEKRLIGAAVMLYDEQLKELADIAESDLYIVPSSIHEVMTVPVYDADPDHLSEIIRDANKTILKETDVLSNSVYYYDRSSGSIDIVREGMAG